MADLNATIRAAEEALAFYDRLGCERNGKSHVIIDAGLVRALLDAAKGSGTEPDPRYVYLRVTRPEGYEDVHPELIVQDMDVADCWEVAVVEAPAPLPPAVGEAAEKLRRYAAEANCEMGDVETAESFAVRCAVRDLLAALDALDAEGGPR